MIERMKNVRPLRADEIECRVGSQNAAGCSILLYKDARVDMRLLDETVGAACWKREHKEVAGEVVCRVSILNCITGEWVAKEDVGAESKTEAVKGKFSDSFKRACFNWGIGRELYTAPFVWINFVEGDTFVKDGKTFVKSGRFRVADIQNNDGAISYLAIVDSNGKGRYTFGKRMAEQGTIDFGKEVTV